MESRFAVSLIGLALISSLAGCSAMLPIAGALVLKEAADRYEASAKPQETSARTDTPTVAAVPDDAAPEVEIQSAGNPRVTSAPLPAQVKVAKGAEAASSPATEIGALATNTALHSEEYTDEEIAASRRLFSAPSGRAKPVVPGSALPLAPAKSGTAPCTPDTSAQANEKAQETVKAASSVPTTKAAAGESATDSAARILATALKQIPNPQAAPATKPAPITPQKAE